MHAQKDFNEVVEHCHTTHVKVDQSNTVDHDHTETVGHDQTLHVKNERKKNVDGNETTVIGENRTETVDGDEKITIHKSRTTAIDIDETLTIAGKRKLTVAATDDEEIAGGREVRVAGHDNLKVLDGANRNEHVTGQYNVTVDGAHYTLLQGGTEKLTQGRKKTYLESAKEVHAKTGSSDLVMKDDGNIKLSGSTRIELEVGSCKNRDDDLQDHAVGWRVVGRARARRRQDVGAEGELVGPDDERDHGPPGEDQLMRSFAEPLGRLEHDAAWFARATELALLHVTCSSDLRGAALKVLPGVIEFHPDNRSPVVVLEDAWTSADPGWKWRAQRLVEHWEGRVRVSADAGLELGSLSGQRPASPDPLGAFGGWLHLVARAVRAPLSGLVVVLAPARIEDGAAFESEVLELARRPELRSVRWVIVDMQEAALD